MFTNESNMFNTQNVKQAQQNNNIQQIVRETTNTNKPFDEIIDISNSLTPSQRQLDYEQEQAKIANKKEKNRKKILYIALAICSLLLIVGAILVAIAVNKHKNKIKDYKNAKDISEDKNTEGVREEDGTKYKYVKTGDKIKKYEVDSKGNYLLDEKGNIKSDSIIESFDDKKSKTIQALEGVGGTLISVGGIGIPASILDLLFGKDKLEQLTYEDSMNSYKETIEAKGTVHKGTNEIRMKLSEGFRDSIDRKDGEMRGNFSGAKLFLNGLVDYNEYALNNGIKNAGKIYNNYQAYKQQMEQKNNIEY